MKKPYLDTAWLMVTVLMLFLGIILIDVVNFLQIKLSGYSLAWVGNLKEFVMYIFPNKETMWVAFTGIVTALGIFITILWQLRAESIKTRQAKETLRGGVKYEIRMMFNTIFDPSEDNLKIENNFYYEVKRNLGYVETKELVDDVVVLYKVSEIYNYKINRYDGTDAVWIVYEERYKQCIALLGFVKANFANVLDDKCLEIIEQSFSRSNQPIKEYLKWVNELWEEVYEPKRDEIFSGIDELVDRMIPIA